MDQNKKLHKLHWKAINLFYNLVHVFCQDMDLSSCPETLYYIEIGWDYWQTIFFSICLTNFSHLVFGATFDNFIQTLHTVSLGIRESELYLKNQDTK